MHALLPQTPATTGLELAALIALLLPVELLLPLAGGRSGRPARS
jgi:hypothetical protein